MTWLSQSEWILSLFQMELNSEVSQRMVSAPLTQVGYVHIEQLRGVFVASHNVINLHLIIEL